MIVTIEGKDLNVSDFDDWLLRIETMLNKKMNMVVDDENGRVIFTDWKDNETEKTLKEFI